MDSICLRWIAAGILLITSLAGVTFPFFVAKVGMLETKWFQLTQDLCTGLVIGVALLHVLADANEDLSKVAVFPAANAGAIFGIIFMVAVQELGKMSMQHFRRKVDCSSGMQAKSPGGPFSVGDLEASLLDDNINDTKRSEALPMHCGHMHGLASIPHINLKRDLARFMLVVMECSIMVHSVLVGLALGVLRTNVEVLTLGAALLFHQFFEGLALGGVAVRLGLGFKEAWHIFLSFTLSCSFGVVLGTLLSDMYDEDDPRQAWVLGMMNALAAGTLLHIGLVELLPQSFSDTVKPHAGFKKPHPVAQLLALTAGCSVMAVLAIWA